MLPYQPRYTENITLHRRSDTVVSCGWSIKDQVYNKISGYNFAAIGNLYSVAGIETLIRNLAHNYQITRLIHLAKSPLDRNVPTTDTLIGVWQGSGYPGIDEDVLIAVVNRVQLLVVHSIDRLLELLAIERGNDDGYLYPQLSYPLKANRSNRQRQSQYQNGLLFRGKRMREVWYRVLLTVYQKGVSIRGGHGGILDMGSVMATFPMETTETIPEHLTRDQLDQYSQTVLTDTEVEGDSYTYGNRIGNQLQDIATILNRDLNSNRAVISLWDPSGDASKPNPPCLISIGFQIRSGRLYCRAVFRSHDIGSGWYPNAYALTSLSEVLLGLLEDQTIILGEMTIISESAHIYESALPQIERLIKVNKPKGLLLDPVGDFVVKVGDCGVAIDHYEYGGLRFTRTYNTPGEILADHPTIDTQHYGYLCSEFTRAKILGVDYKQDRS